MKTLGLVGRRLHQTQQLMLRDRRLPSVTLLTQQSRHHSQFDGTRLLSGNREIVGHGINGSPIYIDCADFPFPAIRYGEETAESCALRESERSDWKQLSLAQKKQLYRHSFCQTYAEFQYYSTEWKLMLGIGLLSVASALLFALIYSIKLKRITPDTFNEERRQAQLRRMIHLQMQPITGISSKWCYSANKWK